MPITNTLILSYQTHLCSHILKQYNQVDWKINGFTLTTPPSDIIRLDLFSVWHLSNLKDEALFGYYGNQLPSGLIWYMSEICLCQRFVLQVELNIGCLWNMEWNSWQMCCDVLCLVYVANKLCLWPYRPQVTKQTNKQTQNQTHKHKDTQTHTYTV